MQIILKEKQTLPKDVKFSTENIGLTMDILKLIKVSHRIAGKRELIIDIQIPLVETSAYEEIRVFITPQIQGTIVSFLHIKDNIILKNVGTDWGYIINEKIPCWSDCVKFAGYVLAGRLFVS